MIVEIRNIRIIPESVLWSILNSSWIAYSMSEKRLLVWINAGNFS